MPVTSEYVLSGYHGIFRPPYSLLNPSSGGSVYVVTSQYRNTLVLIPLVPNFFTDVVKIVDKMQSRKVFFIVPDIGPRFISDYLASWYYIKKTLLFECKLFSRYMPEDKVSEEFLADIIRNVDESASLVICRSQSDVSVLHFQLTKLMVNTAAPYACDVILNDTGKRRILLSEANEEKIDYYNSHPLYDEIHTAYIEGTYPTMTYQEIMRKYPLMVKYLVVNRFGSREEVEYALSKGIHIGKLVNL